MNSARTILVLVFAAALAAAVVVFRPRSQSAAPEPLSIDNVPSAASREGFSPPKISRAEPVSRATQPVTVRSPLEKIAASTNKLERLTLIREVFRVLAAGDRTAAIRAAKGIAEENEREAALL